jgi:hypothetical protein
VPSVEAELARARILTSPTRTGLDLVDRVPQPSAAEVGALAGIGLGLADPPLRVSVYVFGAWNAGAEVGDRLHELVDGGPYRAVSEVSGALLLFAVSEDPGERGERALDRLVRAFHGTW